MTRFKAIRSQSGGIVGMWNNKGMRTLEVDPEIVRVEDLEFTDYIWEGAFRNRLCKMHGLWRRTGFELFRVLRWHLGNFKQTDLTLVIDESSTLFSRPVFSHMLTDQNKWDANLDVCLCLIGDLHYKFGLSVGHVFEDSLIDTGREGNVNQCPRRRLFPTYMAPRLSELETNRYSFPSAIN